MGQPGNSLAKNSSGPERAMAEAVAKRERSRTLEWTATGLLLGILALYLGLVPLGQWQADEFDYFGRLKSAAGQAFLQRLQWSPRLLGETLYLGYGLLANHFRTPLNGWFLGLLWVGFLACASGSALITDNKARRLPVLMLGLAVGAACLTSGPVFQVFYWPAGAVAYLTTLSATLLFFLLALDERPLSSRGQTIPCLALLVAALSSEMGAMFAMCCAFLHILMTRLTSGPREHSATRWWLLPGLVSLAVLLWAAIHRLPVSESAFTVRSAALNNPLRSAASAAVRLVLEVAGWSSGTKRPISALMNVIARLALGAGFAMLYGMRRTEPEGEQSPDRRKLLALAAVFLAACFLSLFASYLHFGYAGGERYETLRRCWILMAYIAVIVFLGEAHLRQGPPDRKFAPIFLMVGVLLPWHVSPLVRQYAAYSRVRRGVEQTFQSGYKPGQQMLMVLPPTGGVITPATLEPGTYTRPSQAATYPGYILSYFGKQILVVAPAEQ